MRYRPLCPAFAVLVLVICILHFCGSDLWSVPSFSADEIEKMEKCRYITGTIAERWRSKEGYTYILAEASVKSKDRYFHPGKIHIVGTEQLYRAGTKIKASGKCSFYEHESNPGGFDKKTYYAAEGICCSFAIRNAQIIGYEKKYIFNEYAAILREKLTNIYTEVLGEERGSILSAMITGERGEMEDETKIHYSVSGLGHLLAISGLHLGIAGMALLRLLVLLRMKRSAASVVSSIALLLYCIFTGSHDSTLRAFIMFSVMAGARCLLRSYDMPSSLSFAGILLLLLRPQRLFVAGFLLSFGAAGGLAFVHPVLRKAFSTNEYQLSEKKRKRFILFVYEGFSVWLSVNLATMPVFLYFYSEFAVYGVIANILFVPMASVVILFGIAGGCAALFLPFLARIALAVPNILVFIQDGAGIVLRAFPFNRVIIGRPDWIRIVSYCIGLLALLLWIKHQSGKEKENKITVTDKRKLIVPFCACILMSLILIRPYHGFAITALDVGQGDGIILTDGNGHTMMIDGGSSSSEKCGQYILLPYLKAEGISKLDGVFVSHSDADHMNGILELLQMKADGSSVISIERLFMPVWMKSDEIGKKLESTAKKSGTETVYLKSGDRIESGDFELDVLFPSQKDTYTGNEGSLVLGLHYHGFSALFTGDLEGEAEETVTNSIGHYDYLKVAHHGSKGSSSEAFFKAVHPLICMISAPEVSIYNHPSPETLQRIENAGSVWIQTGKNGAITARLTDGKIRISTYKE